MPRTVREWHPLEEFAAFLWETESETDPSLSMKDRFLSTLRRLADSSSEGFQGGGNSRCAGNWNRFASSYCTYQLGL